MYRLLYNEFHIIIYIADYSSLAGIINCMDGTCWIADTNIWMAPCVYIHQDIYEGFRRLYLEYCMKLLNIYCLTYMCFHCVLGRGGGVRIFLAECVIWREYCGGRGVLHTFAFLSSTSLIHFICFLIIQRIDCRLHLGGKISTEGSVSIRVDFW